ncbi:hypothetical protein BDZ88DRAFT_104300 [Geranomyces variabilis]|nr:hypothetical protein BDZ88DRAFT_104300 [Geranomyces variabilis]
MSEEENRGNALRSANAESQELVARGSQPLTRQRSATITAGILPVVSFSPPPVAPPVVTSSWNVQDQRDVVEEIVDTVQTPYIISRAEDIDAVIETAGRHSTAGRRGSKHVKRTRSARSQSVGAGAGGDIDGYIAGAPEGGSPVPRMSFAARLANGLRFNSGGKGAYSNPPTAVMADTRDVAASHASFAESFPAKTIVSYHVGLPAPVPAAAADTLPESYFPQTLTTASEDIDVLTNIGTEGSVDPRSGGATRRESNAIAEDEDDFDVDKIFNLADSSASDTLGQDGQATGHSKATRPASADRWSRKGKGAAARAAGASHSLPCSPMVAAPCRVHQAITASNTDRMTDIDDVLASDPEPNGLEGTNLPRTIVDAGDYLLLDSAATRPTPLSLRTSSVPILSTVEKSLDVKASKGANGKSGALLSSSVDGILGQTQSSPHARPASKFEWTTPTHQAPAITRDDQLRYFRDDARAAEDILALVDMGSKISPTEEVARPKKSRRGWAQDIQTLVLAGESNDAGSDSDTSVVSESPGGDAQALFNRRASSAGRKRGAAPRRVSYIEFDAYSVIAEHPTSPTVAVPTTTYAGSLDIDQLFAGESPSGWANRHVFPPGQHHAIERGEANDVQAANIVVGAGEADPSQFSTITRPATRRRSVSLGSANLEGAAAPAPPITAAPRRLTCLDISHFMGIAETVEADYEGLPLGAGAKREVGKDTPHSSDIINYLSLGELPTTDEGDEQLQTADLTVGPGGALGPTMLARQRRGSSMGQLNVGQKRSHAAPGRQEWHPPATARVPLDVSGGTALAVRLRRSLDELAISHHFPKQGSFREMFYNNPSGWQHPPAVASSIVGVRPPKIDIDELVGPLRSALSSPLCNLINLCANSFTGVWKLERQWKENSLYMEAALQMGRLQRRSSYPLGEGPVCEA